MDFDEYLSFCEKLGRTPSGLAEDAGVSRTTISRWKSGASSPSPENIKKLKTYISFLMQNEKKLEERLKTSEGWKDQADTAEETNSDEVDDKVQSMFDKRMLLFDRTSKLCEADIDIVAALVDRLVGDNE